MCHHLSHLPENTHLELSISPPGFVPSPDSTPGEVQAQFADGSEGKSEAECSIRPRPSTSISSMNRDERFSASPSRQKGEKRRTPHALMSLQQRLLSRQLLRTSAVVNEVLCEFTLDADKLRAVGLPVVIEPVGVDEPGC